MKENNKKTHPDSFSSPSVQDFISLTITRSVAPRHLQSLSPFPTRDMIFKTLSLPQNAAVEEDKPSLAKRPWNGRLTSQGQANLLTVDFKVALHLHYATLTGGVLLLLAPVVFISTVLILEVAFAHSSFNIRHAWPKRVQGPSNAYSEPLFVRRSTMIDW